MMHPSYSELMDIINQESESEDNQVVNSRYAVVMATAKRAREIVNGQPAAVDMQEGDKPLSVAVEEIEEGKMKIVKNEE